MTPFLDVPVLAGRGVRLEPLSPAHADDLRAASADGELWRTWVTTVPTPEAMDAEIVRRIETHAAGGMVPWATCEAATGRAVGMTTFLNLEPEHRRLEIGATWLGRSAQRSAINTEAKLLQLTRAFDDLDSIAVEFRTHWHNRRSRAAIERLGAKQDGVLRSHRIWRDGTLRDTVVYSITAAEWPAVRLGLRERLALR